MRTSSPRRTEDEDKRLLPSAMTLFSGGVHGFQDPLMMSKPPLDEDSPLEQDNEIEKAFGVHLAPARRNIWDWLEKGHGQPPLVEPKRFLER